MRTTPLVTCLFMLATPMALAQTNIGNERLEERLAKEMREMGTDFLGHETVAVPEDGHPKKYLLLDFEKHENAQHEERQERIHNICTRILRNRELVRSLSADGFHMVSVAFGRRHQYDCLQSRNGR